MKSISVTMAWGSIAALTLIAALPWGLPSEYRFFLPLLPVVAIHFWSLRHPGLVPDWFVFLAGLTLDILTQGPLGYWSLIYLAAHVLAVTTAPAGAGGQLVRLGLFCLALVVVAAVAWLVASIYFLELADVRPYAIGAGMASLGALLLIPLLHALDPATAAKRNTRLVRGG